MLAFFLVYGGWNIAQDFWLEQVVKRGTVSVEIPYAIAPAPTAAWALVAVGSVAAYIGLRRTATTTPKAADPRI